MPELYRRPRPPVRQVLHASLSAFRFRPLEQWQAVRELGKWLVVVTPVAVVVGSLSALFLRLLGDATTFRLDHGWLVYLLPLAGLTVAALYHRWGRSVEGGSNLVVEAIHEPGAALPPRIVPLIFAGTVVSHLFGASVGREGTAVQIGGGVASAFQRLFRLDPAGRRTLLMTGVAAGFGSVFGTPVAGAIFAIEVLAIGRMQYGALIPVLYAALAADFTTAAWGVHHTAYHIDILPKDGNLPFDAGLMAKVALAAVAFGCVALLFSELAHGLGRLMRNAVPSPLARPVVGGVIIVALAALLGTDAYLGLGVTSAEPGQTSIVSSFHDGGASPFAWWWKVAFTVLALASGFKGGEVTPLFFIGAALGNRLALLLGAPVDLFAGLGFVAVFAGAANAPLACLVMGIELFGSANAPYLAVACFIAYLVSGHSGIYLSQRVGTAKVGTFGRERGEVLTSLRDFRESSVVKGAAIQPPEGASPGRNPSGEQRNSP